MNERIFLIFLLVILTGCESREERLFKELQGQIENVVRLDWSKELPFYLLFTAKKACDKIANLNSCDIVDDQLRDISQAFYTCMHDQRSKLCRSLTKTIQNHQIISELSEESPFTLPETPFYWSLPTLTLETVSGEYDYRSEVSNWWWSRWRIPALCGILASFIYPLLLLGRFILGKRKAKLDQLQRNAEAERAAAEARRSSKESFQRRKVEEERLKKLDEENRIAELAQKKRLQAEQNAREQERVAKLADEQAEARKALDAAFQHFAGKKPRQ